MFRNMPGVQMSGYLSLVSRPLNARYSDLECPYSCQDPRGPCEASRNNIQVMLRRWHLKTISTETDDLFLTGL